ncbi:hypothetical protein H632_c3446p0, partial [Helicosporidium sp. ATCC 50920]
MPELVEVDVTRRVLKEVAAGQRIVAAEVADDSSKHGMVEACVVSGAAVTLFFNHGNLCAPEVFVDISSSSLKALLEGKTITE